MLNGQYVGCTTGFSQSDKTDIFIPNQKVDATATPYLQRLVAVDLIKVEQVGEPVPIIEPMPIIEPVLIGEVVVDGIYPESSICVPQSSEWSRPITWEMVNKPDQSGGVTVYLGSANYWIDLKNIHTIDEFFANLVRKSQGDSHFNVNTRKNNDGSISVQYVPVSIHGVLHAPETIKQNGEFYVYDARKIGTSGESVIYLADAFDSPPSFVSCIYPSPIFR